MKGAGSVSNKQMEEHVAAIYDRFNARRKALAAAEADEQDRKVLNASDDETLVALQKEVQDRKK
ncbi:MAG: hypothetical protein IJ838_06900 [Paludibacteraceae bacterium]|nr:hypothetical protein [Paludibacteraceae bacterium]